MREKPLSVAILADDLTGALDTAAPFAMYGLDTWLTLAPDRVGLRVLPHADVVALTTESRHLASDQAAKRVEVAAEALCALQPRILFKKIDSLLRGNVAAEIVAALSAAGRRHAIITPAVPSQNRTMRGGTVYVNGSRLAAAVGAETSDWAETAHVPHVLQRVPSLHIHQVSAGAFPALAGEPGLHAYVVDAESDADLDWLAQFVLQRAPEILPVGAMGLGRALARALGRESPPPTLPVASGVLLFVVGSTQEASAAQIEALRVTGAVEIEVSIAPDLDIDLPLPRLSLQQNPLLVVRPELATRPGASAQVVAERLGRAAAAIVQHVGVSALMMAGGDTAAACLKCLGAESLQILGELHDGIAYGAFRVGPRRIPFFTKSGSFGRPDTWTRLAARLRTGSDP